MGDLAGMEGFDVTLAIGDEVYQQLYDGLPRIFRGMPDTLIIGSGDIESPTA